MSSPDTVETRAIVQQWLETAQAEGQADAYDSRRSHARYTWNQPMELRVGNKVYYVYSRNISESGIGLVCRERLNEGGLVHIRRDASEPWITARIAHVTQTIGAFKTGIDLDFEF